MSISRVELLEIILFQIGGHPFDNADPMVIHNMTHTHSITGQGTCLIGTDCSHCAQSFDNIQILHKDSEFKHFLGCNGEGNCQLREKSFRDIGHNDTDQKNDRFYPSIPVEFSQNEENHT